MPDAIQKPCAVSFKTNPNSLEIRFSGDWVIGANLPELTDVLAAIKQAPPSISIGFLLDDLGRWDSLLLTDLIKILNTAQKHTISVDKTSLPESIQDLLALVYAVPEQHEVRIRTPRKWSTILQANLNRWQKELVDVVEFIGETALSAYDTFRGRSHFRSVDLWLHIQECGPSALPIVTLISLLVGLILAFVGAVQLSLFGAQIYIANLVSLGMTREMGGLMTAIIMSGRTGAAYAAQLGTMRVNEEIDALKTMNLQPMAFLVLPRMLALIVIMPLLCLYADLMGIIGGALVSINIFDVSVAEYVDRTIHAVKMKDFVIGFVKCAVFGVLIALSGCMRGMQCGRSASAVGDAATSAVVTSIVFIVVADSIMTIICNRLGI
jgi:phospholipid/cholesterol/gamma-HCH transport system permease protein